MVLRPTLDLDFDNELRVGARLNPLWLVGEPTGGRALEVRVAPALALAGTLGAWYERVDVVDGSAAPQTATELASLRTARYDLVTAYGCAPSRRVLAELVRVMSPGGRLYVAIRARWWYGRLRRREQPLEGEVGGPLLHRRFAGAGFRVVATFAAAPSLERPRLFVPATPGGVASLGHVTREGERRDRIWSWVARGGLHHTLLPVSVFVLEATQTS